ncbi:hypothetical protein BK724_04600, partial [Bacillus thuringiensis serovar sooncheon]
TKFFISFAAFDVNFIGDLFYITPLYTNRQYLFLNIFKLIFLHSIAWRRIYKDCITRKISSTSL